MEVCKVRKGWYTYASQCLLPPYADASSQLSFQVSCVESAQLDIALYQSSKRGDLNMPQTDLGFMVLKYTHKRKHKFKPIAVVERQIRRMVMTDIVLGAGDYVIVPFSFGHWTDNPNCQIFHSVAISLHSSTELNKFRPISRKKLLSQAIICTALDFGERQSLGKYGNCIYLDLGLGYCIIFENTSTDFVPFILKFEANGYLNTRGSFSTMDLIPPKHR